MANGKISNPCKICKKSVALKNGLQCKGACKKWTHYECLNYSLGKINDIKAGALVITCPCQACQLAKDEQRRSQQALPVPEKMAVQQTRFKEAVINNNIQNNIPSPHSVSIGVTPADSRNATVSNSPTATPPAPAVNVKVHPDIDEKRKATRKEGRKRLMEERKRFQGQKSPVNAKKEPQKRKAKDTECPESCTRAATSIPATVYITAGSDSPDSRDQTTNAPPGGKLANKNLAQAVSQIMDPNYTQRIYLKIKTPQQTRSCSTLSLCSKASGHPEQSRTSSPKRSEKKKEFSRSSPKKGSKRPCADDKQALLSLMKDMASTVGQLSAQMNLMFTKIKNEPCHYKV